jgi:3-oxoadipate enol-lactonase
MNSVVVWLGSLGSTTAMWDPQVAAFGGRTRCVAIDLPGHGSAPVTPGQYSIDGLADRVADTLDRLEVAEAHLVGSSIGGMIAMSLGRRHPARVERLVLIGTSAHLPPASAWTDRAATVRAEGAAAVAEAVVARWITPAYAAAHTDDVARFEAMISSVDREGYAGCCDAIAAMDQRDGLTQIGAPTLVIVGRDDPATPVEHAEEIAAGVPGARLEVVSGAHLPSVESVEAVNALLAEHLFPEHTP